jgi:hypothetical protein
MKRVRRIALSVQRACVYTLYIIHLYHFVYNIAVSIYYTFHVYYTVYIILSKKIVYNIGIYITHFVYIILYILYILYII